MGLDILNGLINTLKESNFVQNFIDELSKSLDKNLSNTDYSWNSLSDSNLTLYGTKITGMFQDQMVIERRNILQNYAEKTKDAGEMYYIYSSNDDLNSYDFCNCSDKSSNKVYTLPITELPDGTSLGSVLRKQGNNFILDYEATKIVGNEINAMIKEKIKEQCVYLDSKRIDGHTYEASEKYNERIWLYDLNNSSDDGIIGVEEVDFPQDLYETAKQGDLFIYKNGEYKKKIE